MTRQRRAVSSVIAVVLMVAVVVILSATVSAAVLSITEDLSEPAPTVAQTSGDFIPGADDQEVRVTHLAGDSVRVESIEIIVRASGPNLDTKERLINLPADGSDIDKENLRNDNGLINKGYGDAGPADPNQVYLADILAGTCAISALEDQFDDNNCTNTNVRVCIDFPCSTNYGVTTCNPLPDITLEPVC